MTITPQDVINIRLAYKTLFESDDGDVIHSSHADFRADARKHLVFFFSLLSCVFYLFMLPRAARSVH